MINYLKNAGNYCDKDILIFEEKIKLRPDLKDEILLQEGVVCKSIFYNITGAFYQYNFNDDMEINVIDLHSDNEWFFNHNSFMAQKPSDTFIKSFTDSRIAEITIESLHELLTESPAFFHMFRILEQTNSRLHFFDNRLTPTQKYKYILDNRPELIQKFPLKIIASYLKISPETLSRVRESFSKGKITS